MAERGIIYNADAIVPLQILRKDIIKNIHDDIAELLRCKEDRLQAWWLEYSKNV